jgi:phosphoserine aminotransferase
MDLPWAKLDATCFSWQKVLGGEAAHGMLVLSPRAVARLESHEPPWPLPKIFRLTKDGKLHEGFFAGETLNTPSMLALEDYLNTLAWAESIGGLDALIARTNENSKALAGWERTSEWATFTAADERVRSTTSVCLKITDRSFARLPVSEQFTAVRRFAAILEDEGIAYDIASHRTAPPGLRIWCGATVETEDVVALTPWLDWAWNKINAA